MNVFITGVDGSLGEALSNMFERDGCKVFGTPRGLIGKPTVERACDDATASCLGGIDLLVLNDGINHLSFIGNTPEEDEDIMAVNVMSQYWTLNWFVKHGFMGRKVIFIASQTHRVPQRTTALYCASKAAIVQLSRVAARELGPKGTQVNVLCPGKIDDTLMSAMTDRQVMDLRGWSEQHMNEYARTLVPLGRFTDTDEVAEAVRWLSHAPAYVHGAVIDMTGGV